MDDYPTTLKRYYSMQKDQLYRLQCRLEVVEAAIADTEARLPAHSIKPSIMQELISLEDERDTLIKDIELLRAST
jgi:hypothetical protein